MRKDVSIHEREEVFEVDGEDRPWVCEGQTGKGEIKKGIKRERLRGGRVHVINSLFQMRESAANCGGDRQRVGEPEGVHLPGSPAVQSR